MTKKIFRSILAATLAVLLVSLVIVMGCLYEYFGRVQEYQLRDELRLAAYGVEGSGRDYFERLAAQDYRYPRTPDYRLTWIAPDGTVLFDTVDPAGQMDNHADRIEVREAFVSGESSSVRYSATLTRRTLYCARLLNNGTVLRISIDRATPLTLLLAMFQPILLTAAAAIILSAVLASWMAKRIVRPLNTLDLEHPLDNDAYEELAPLLRRIHQQRRQISDQLALDAAEQAAAEQNRKEFTANVSHELKTPLQSILGSAEMLEGGLVRPEDIPRFSGLIHAEAARLVALVEDIIHLSQLDEGVAPARESVDLLAVAEQVASALEDSAARKKVRLSVTGEHIRISGVSNFLYEMVYNLCDNAIKYNVEGGRVDISVSGGGGGAVVTVKDTGIGIPAECQNRIFERFFRVDKSRSKASGGTGLGLSIVKHIAQYHHGEIELNSRPGQGTTVSVRLPEGA